MADRPVLPTTGQNPDEQRLRAGLSELVRRFLDSGLFLQRFLPGSVLRTQTSATGQVLPAQWGTLNSVGPSVAVTVALPIPQPKNIGVPLPVTKTSPTGVLYIKPTVGTDGRTQALLDGSPTGISVTQAGRIDFISDGMNWSSNRSAGGGGLSAASGMTVPASAWRLPATYSPIGLWNFDESITSLASPVLPALTVATGTMRYAPIFPGVNAGILGGATGAYLEMPATGTATLFHLRGDVSVQLLMWQTDKIIVAPNNSSPLACFAGVGVSAGSENVQWGLYLADNQRADWFTESGDPSTGFSHTISQPVLPWNNVRPVLYGARRSGNTVQHFLDGKPLGASASGATPTLGTNGRLFLGGATGDTPAPQMLISSLKITPNAMTDAQFLADYNASLGQYYGTRY